jgi:3-methyladenine DNA glycosylase AlkD
LADNEWLRRISLVSLVHYRDKNAIFLPLNQVLPLVSNCIQDQRTYVQAAVGWVLREMGRVYEAEIIKFLETHCDKMGTQAFSWTIERLNPEKRTRICTLRKARVD